MEQGRPGFTGSSNVVSGSGAGECESPADDTRTLMLVREGVANSSSRTQCEKMYRCASMRSARRVMLGTLVCVSWLVGTSLARQNIMWRWDVLCYIFDRRL